MMPDIKSRRDSYDRRPRLFQDASREEWIDWRWQQKHALRDSGKIRAFFPDMDEKQVRTAREWEKRDLRFALTPYMLSLVRRDDRGNPLPDDPIWRQSFPGYEELLRTAAVERADEYSPSRENWEREDEMLTAVAHHKYDNRVILYTTDSCLAYCGYCLRSLQSTAEQEKHGEAKAVWKETLEAIKSHPEIEEVIFSGGDPLVLENSSLERMLSDVRDIPTVKAIRIGTRAFTHNPYRLDEGFCRLLKDYGVAGMVLHAAHPDELTAEFQECVERIRAGGARTQLLAQIPLIKGINDDAGTLRRLFMGLYASGVKPYYLLHNMPNTPAAASQRTSVKRGVELLNSIGRAMSHPAMPEYIILHRSGKRTVPQEIGGTSEFIYGADESGHPVVRFKSWKGIWETYLDGKD